MTADDRVGGGRETGGGERGRVGSGVVIRAVDEDLREAAAHRLVTASMPGDGDAGRRFLALAQAQSIDLRHFVVSLNESDGSVRHSVLIVPGAGGTGMVFTSQPEDEAAEAELGDVADAACALAADSDVRLAQALLLPGELGVSRALDRAGFRHLARLAYMRRRGGARSIELEGAWSDGLGAETVRAALTDGSGGHAIVEARRLSSMEAKAGDEALLAGLEASYEATLDCPELCRLRRPSDVLSSHRSVGVYDASLWWVIHLNDEVVGAMLWSVMRDREGPDEGDVGRCAELVYIGVGPSARGFGLGRLLLGFGLCDLASRGVDEATCAVDLGNNPARGLYASFGFRRFAERSAWIRSLGGF